MICFFVKLCPKTFAQTLLFNECSCFFLRRYLFGQRAATTTWTHFSFARHPKSQFLLPYPSIRSGEAAVAEREGEKGRKDLEVNPAGCENFVEFRPNFYVALIVDYIDPYYSVNQFESCGDLLQ